MGLVQGWICPRLSGSREAGGDPLCCAVIRTVPSSSGCLGVKSCFVGGAVVVSGPAEGWDNSPSGGRRGSAAARQLGLSVNLRSLGTRKADGHDAKSGPAGCRWQHFSNPQITSSAALCFLQKTERKSHFPSQSSFFFGRQKLTNPHE